MLALMLYVSSLFFLFGLIFGSFLNVCIYRLPRGLSVVSPRSACPGCGSPIAWYDNIPVLSWLILRGRCRGCRQPITPRYMFVELAVGLLFLFSFCSFGLTSAALRACVLSFLMVGLICTDAETFLLPDALTLPGIFMGLALSIIAPLKSILELSLYHESVFEGPSINWRLLSFGDAALGAVFGGGAIWLIGYLYKMLRGVEGMGFGDVKLMALVGAFLGYEGALMTLFLGSISGSGCGLLMMALRYRRRRRELKKGGFAHAERRARLSAMTALRAQQLPFGVFLGGSALLTLFFFHRVLKLYLRATMGL